MLFDGHMILGYLIGTLCVCVVRVTSQCDTTCIIPMSMMLMLVIACKGKCLLEFFNIKRSVYHELPSLSSGASGMSYLVYCIDRP
jgi:hypothetical protein